MMKPRNRTRLHLAQTLSALLLATAVVAPAVAAVAETPAKTSSMAEGQKAASPCAPTNPCAPARKKKKSAENPCAPANPCAPKQKPPAK
jgi:hypothetical protein